MQAPAAHEEGHTEAEFIENLHDRQMNARSREEAIYYRMHKEMTPALIALLIEAMHSESPQRRGAQTAMAYSKFIASTIVSTAEMLGGTGEENKDNREGLTRTLLAAVTEYTQNSLESDRKTTI